MNNCTRLMFKPSFERGLGLPTNATCQQCDAQLRHPLLPWIVGTRFPYSAERVFFVGKAHRGTPGEILPSGIIDPTAEVEDILWDIGWPYWSYTREIAENLYGPTACDQIAFSNIVKCTNVGADDDMSGSNDLTTYQMAHCCINLLGVIWTEVERLEPFTLIFYTYSLFREMLQEIPVAVKGTVVDITPEEHYISCLNKNLGWWERKCATPWTTNMRVLVVGHPERMGREEYVELLTSWIRPNYRMQPTSFLGG